MANIGPNELTNKQKMIVKFWDGSPKSTANAAHCSDIYVSKCLKMPKVVKAIQARDGCAVTAAGRAVLTREQRQNFWSSVIGDEAQNMADRLRASELLGRSNADFTDKSLVGSLDKELETMSGDEIKARIRDNLKLIETPQKTGTDDK